MRLHRFAQSLSYALRGIRYAFIHEANFRIQCGISLVILVLVAVFPLKMWECVLLVMMCAFVLVLELINTAFEVFADLLVPRLHHHVATVKDVMAGAVLVASCAALIIGILILAPHGIAYLVPWIK